MKREQLAEIEETIQNYIEGKGEKNLVPQLQLPFKPKEVNPELGVLGYPTRTLDQVLKKDLTITISRIRKIYVPNYLPTEVRLLEEGLYYIANSRIRLDKIDQSEFESLPLEVLFFFHTFSLIETLKDGLDSKDQGNVTTPVGFSPNSSFFETDIRSATFEDYSFLTSGASSKPKNMERLSSTKIYYLINRLYTLRDPSDEYFIEGADFLTVRMFQSYFAALKSRVPLISKFSS